MVEILEFDLDRLDAGDVAILLQAFFSFGNVFFLFAEEIELLAVVL